MISLTTRVIDELKRGNIEVCKDMSYLDIYNIFKTLNGQEKYELLSIILPKFMVTKNWYSVAPAIFDMINLDPRFDEYSLYLLNNNLVNISNLGGLQIERIIVNKSLGFSFIIDHLEELIDTREPRIEPSNLIELVFDHIKNNSLSLDTYLKRFLYSPSGKVREEFIYYLAKEDLLPNIEIVVAALYKNPDDFYREKKSLISPNSSELILSHLPYFVARIAELKNDQDYKKLLEKYYAQFFYAEEKAKLSFIYEMGYVIPEIQKKYQEIFRWSKEEPMLRNFLDFIITSLINVQDETFITDYIKDKKVKYEASGTQSTVFKVGDDSVLKFSRFKYQENNVTQHFLIVPNVLKVIKSRRYSTIYIEKMPYLGKSYNGEEMTVRDIDNFLEEAKKQGLEIKDPHCLKKYNDNFGFLKSYKDATLVGVKSHDELPDWFKERPLVLYDIDMVSYANDKSKLLINK